MIPPHFDRPGHYVFGNWSFDPEAGDLYDGAATVRLEPQVAKLLHHFLDTQHKVISRDELMAAVWGNRVVSDDAINRCVSILRQILSPQDKQAYIETVMRKGYLAHFPPAPLPESLPARTPHHRKQLFLLALAAVAGILLYLVASRTGVSTREPGAPTGAGPPMVAVLPFVSASMAGDNEFFANGMHDDLLTRLAQLQSIRVISSTSVKAYRDSERSIRRIGEELGADVILEGSVQIVGKRIRINAQLIDARTDEHLWAESYDRELSPANIFEVQNGIARAIARELNFTLTAQDSEQLALIPTQNMAAYRAYHRAVQLRDTPGYSVDSPEYRQALELAVELDPTFSRAWAELVSILAFSNFAGDRPDMTLRAEQALQTLHDVAPGSADYLIGQAAYVYYALKDYDRAHDILSRALKMNPSDVLAVRLRSWIERRQGDFEAYLRSKREARSLDPRNPVLTDALLKALLITHRYEEAWTEQKLSPVESFTTAYTEILHSFQESRDFPRLRESMREICQYYKEANCGWDAFIANRDYPGALHALDKTQDEVREPGLSEYDRRQIFTYWLLQDYGFLARALPQWQAKLAGDRDDSGEFRRHQSYIAAAMLAGIQGNSDEAEQLVQRWHRQAPVDRAMRIVLLQDTCRVLGMIAATHAAVECIREGIAQASLVIPFFEPYLPFYDSLRDQPEFIAMLADIDGPGQAMGVTPPRESDG